MAAERQRLFVGRKDELAQWLRILADPRGQAVLVVGQRGMGKTLLVDEMARLAREHPDLRCGAVRYEVTKTDTVASILELILDHAYRAAHVTEGSFEGTKRRLEQWRSFLNVFKIGDLVMSLRRDPKRDTREQFVETLEQISDKMPDHGRVVFVIDPEKYMQADSDRDWAIVVRQLPPKIKILFAQRPEDVLAPSSEFRGLKSKGQVLQIPEDRLSVLEEEALDDLVRIRAQEMNRDELQLRKAVARYNRHPYAVSAALDLIAAGKPIDELPSDPTPEAIAATQWKKIGQGGATGQLGDKAVALFQAYAVLEVPVPDDVVGIVAAIEPTERTALMQDGYLGPLLRPEGDNRRIYHAILADHIRRQLANGANEPYHRRAIEELRQRLKTAKETHTAPDGLSAERLCIHVREVEGLEAFVTSLVDECTQPLVTLGLLETVISLTQVALGAVATASSTEAGLLCNLALVFQTRGDLDHAEVMLHKSLVISEELGNQKGIAAQNCNLALVHLTRGELDRAEAMFRKSLVIHEKLGDKEGVASQCGNLAIVYQSRGDQDGAEKMFCQSLAMFEELGKQERMARQYGKLAVIYRKRGDVDRAEKIQRKSLVIDEKLGDQEGMAIDYGNLGLIYQERGDLDAAEAMFRKSLVIDEKLCRRAGVANQYGNLGVIYKMRGDMDRAEAMFCKSLDIDEQLGRPQGIAISHANLGRLCETRGDLDEARLRWTKARDLFEKIGMKHMVQKMDDWLSGLENEG